MNRMKDEVFFFSVNLYGPYAVVYWSKATDRKQLTVDEYSDKQESLNCPIRFFIFSSVYSLSYFILLSFLSALFINLQ